MLVVMQHNASEGDVEAIVAVIEKLGFEARSMPGRQRTTVGVVGNDGRVDPMHSRKMIAELQYMNTSGSPILLRTSGNTGHGSGTPLSETISQQADRLAFLFHSLDMQYRVLPDIRD